MEKFVNSIIQMIAYFLIVYIIFFIAQKIGVWTEASIWPFAIGSTLGWVIVKEILPLIKRKIYKRE